MHPSEKMLMDTTGIETQKVADDLAAAMRSGPGRATFSLGSLQADYEIGVGEDGPVLFVREAKYPLHTPLHSAAATLAVYEEFANAHAIFVRGARLEAMKMAASVPEDEGGKAQRALAALAALAFVS